MCATTPTPTMIDQHHPTIEDFQFVMSAFAPVTKPQKRRRRQVSFAPYVYAADSGPLSKEDLPELWFSQSDLAGFKSSAKALAKSSGPFSSCPSGERLTTTMLESKRGLEHCTPQRQRHRYMSIKCTLSAHRRGMSSEQTAMIAAKCNSWSTETAFVQACHDFATVYQPSMKPMIPSVATSPPEFPFLVTRRNKRSAASAASSSTGDESQSQSSSRRVRQRTMVC